MVLKGHAIVTGAGRGIGAAISRMLAARGCPVTLAGRTATELESVARELRSEFKIKTHISVVDITVEEQVDQELKKSIAALGAPSILVNNAGAAESAPLHAMKTDLWNRMLAVNLTGSFYVTRAALPSMKEAGCGRIINVSSTAGVEGYQYVSAYCAAKHGLVGFTRSLALELKSSGITVNAVCPGFTDTDLFKNSIEAVAHKTKRPAQEIEAEFLKDVPSGRLITPEEVAEQVVWLCEDAQSGVTGEAIVIQPGENR